MRILNFLKRLLPKVPEITERRSFLKGMGALLIAPILPIFKPQYDPIIISMIRRSMPSIIAYDLCNVQPMTGPTGKIFTWKPTKKKWKDILEYNGEA